MVAQVRSSAPPTRTMGTSPPADWLMASEARGTPPNGKQNRSASARVMARGRASHLRLPGGTSSPTAAAW